jgi:hypothetical protein
MAVAAMRVLCLVLMGALLAVVGCTHAPPAHLLSDAPLPQATWYPAGPPSPSNAAPGAAPYFVTLAIQHADEPALVTDAITGKVLAVVHPPVRGTRFTGAAAAGDDHTFVLGAQERPNAPAVGLYELRLGPAGHPSALVLLPVPAIGYGDPFAVSADGRKLAIATATAKTVTVVSLATGAVALWKAASGQATDLSWAGNRFLAFQWSDGSRSPRAARARSGVRLLDTAAPGGNLLASRLIIHQAGRTHLGKFTGLAFTLISADGSTLFATMLRGGPSNPKAEVVEFSAHTGQALAVVMPAQDESGMGSWCGVLWTDPSGTHATAACGEQGRIDNGHFTTTNVHVPTYNFSAPRGSFIAW